MLAVHFGWGIGIRTPTNRVRVCRATVTQFPKIGNKIIIPDFACLSRIFCKFYIGAPIKVYKQGRTAAVYPPFR